MKKTYKAPELITLGDVKTLTLGEGLRGSDDQWWFFRWGTDSHS